MDDKRISESLEKFYKNNNIDPRIYTADQMEAYMENKCCDPRISEEELKEKIDHWIERFGGKDKEYFLSLFENYVYLSERELRYRFYNLCNCIFQNIGTYGIKKEEVLFVTVSSANGIGSGGDFIRNFLLTVNMEWGIYKGQIISDIGKAKKDVLENRKAIILIDDIIGTGFSIRGTLEEFLTRFPEIHKADYLWGAAGILVTKNAVRYIKKKGRETGIDLHIFAEEKNYVRSCMKGNYIFPENEIREVEKIITAYEREIGFDKKSGKDFTMGFRACKLLLSFYYNTPNDTLCSFWKYTDKNFPVFPRDKYMRPSIDALKEKKNLYRNNAYLKGCVEKK